MNKRMLYFLIALICLSLTGIIIVQFFWIRNAIRVREAQFNRSVNDALCVAVSKLETRENVRLLARTSLSDSLKMILRDYRLDSLPEPDPRRSQVVRQEDFTIKNVRSSMNRKPSQNFKTRDIRAERMRQHKQQKILDSLMRSFQAVTVTVDPFRYEMNFDWNEAQLEKIDSILRNREMLMRDEGTHYITEQWTLVPGVTGNNEHMVRYYDLSHHSLPPPSYQYHQQDGFSPPLPPEPPDEMESYVRKLTEKTKKLKNVLQKLTLETESRPKSISERINRDTLELVLKKSLADKEVLLPFEFAVFSPSADSDRFPLHSANFDPGRMQTDHKVILFPNDIISKPNQLLVFFPGQKGQVLRSVSLLMLGSILFTLIIVLTSGASIIVMIRQKKISDIKTDFINNMTHEFKTPIATISIAADSISNPRVISEPEKIRDYTRIIKEENNRMNARVEQVLQMALLDSRDFKLRPVVTDMHSMISRAADHYRLQVEKREGSLVTEFEASNPMVEADEDHIRNVLMNLLDNANKYSTSRPQIRISTFNRGEKFFFCVEDKGAGMSPETQKRVFDKFFRVTSGNIHSVKGFGLGLSYVKAIVLAHHGEISLVSEVGKGSRFEISLPYIPGMQEKVVYIGKEK